MRDGGEEFVDALSVTFHVTSYLHGDISDIPAVMHHLLAVKDLDYPIGWLERPVFEPQHYGCGHTPPLWLAAYERCAEPATGADSEKAWTGA